MKGKFMKARKLEEKYDVSVVNVPMDTEVYTYCVCGHHVSKHEGRGSAGKCIECAKTLPNVVVEQTAHNFHPRKWRRTHNELEDLREDIQIQYPKMKELWDNEDDKVWESIETDKNVNRGKYSEDTRK